MFWYAGKKPFLVSDYINHYDCSRAKTQIAVNLVWKIFLINRTETKLGKARLSACVGCQMI